MTLDSDSMPKDVKPTKASRGPEEHRETFQCACKKGGACHRESHLEGSSCEQNVTLSKSNRHKVCNQCRKNKSKKGDGMGMSQHRSDRIIPATIIPPVPVMDSSFLAVPLPQHAHHHDMPSAIPEVHMGHLSHHHTYESSSSRGHHGGGDNGQNVGGKMQCMCEKGGSCSRVKHVDGTACDRIVTITKNDKHTRCKGCRYLKKNIKGTKNANSADVPAPSQPQLLSMSAGPVPTPLHAMPLPMALGLNHL